MMRRLRVDGSEVTVLPVVKGLVSEEDTVAKAIAEVRPDAVAVSISKEELAALRNKDDYGRYELSDLEDTYAAFLETFGEVKVPPPCFVRCLDICTDGSVPILPLDMNDEVYTEAYCEHVGTGDMIKESFFSSRAGRKKYDLSSPQNFARDWDRRVNRSKGFRALELARERHMASVLRTLSSKYRNILAVVECERADGVGSSLVSPPDAKDAGVKSAAHE